MADEISVKINRRDGVVEITGSDKIWIAEQLDKLSPVYTASLAESGETPEEISSGNSTTASGSNHGAPARKPTRTRARTSAKASDLAGRLTKQVTDKMHAYFAERPQATSTHQNRAAVIATFLMDDLERQSIEAGDLIAVYRAMGWAPPKNPSAVIKNATERNHYFGGMRDGRVSLTPTGEHFGRHGSKEEPAKK